jgi:hypothetical protein
MIETWWPSTDDNEWSTWHTIFDNKAGSNDIRPFFASYPVIMIKSCFPSANMSGLGTSIDTLNPTIKSVANYKWHWRSLISVMKGRPQNFFIIWTNAPRVADSTNASEAALSEAFCRWAKDTLAVGLDPVAGAFPRNVFVFDFFHLLAGADGMLPLQLASSSSDSHPNAAATTLVAPQLVKQVFDAALAYEFPTLTGIPNSLGFGNVVTGHSVPYSFQVVNSSINTLRIDSVYTQTNSFGAAINKHLANLVDTIVVTVSFLPNRYGTFIDTVFIRNNSQSALVKIPLSGSCPIPTFTSLKTSIAYGNVAKNTTKKDTVKVINASINSLTIDSINTKSSAFTVDRISGTVGTDTLKVVVSFTPTTIASYTDTVCFRNNSATPLVKIPLSGNGALTGVDQIPTGIPTIFSLAQNYPNPFNPSTTIGFRVPGEKIGSGVSGLGSSWVKLAVYDLLGREVAVLVDERKGPGRYEVKFDGSGLSSGVYFYRIHVRPLDSAIGRDSKSGAGDFVETRKLGLVR